ncbi:mitochondrial 3-hydroxybutyryl-CoA dehydrogenase [Andalucia godoyi]|uniref:Mitochondrial 3-hydroxybutyryl-CoA dehydrogenase n=1 Tax=Andalucia godoyi TaxID=505711 RepID=A0A8K0AHP4_ANDGO|nr:mitochondrial 3-hydroxybutyryl-CoA dehydrogenase [Andalucia godoyi]|eukprot:ANDGO_08608.mRNA.1 mitochondrial 3-hydroxybutyryl-CoA dehydrogenase
MLGRRLFSTETASKLIGVVGGGQMGTGIAFVGALRAQSKVLVVDGNATQLDKSSSFMDSLLSKQVQKGLLTEVQAKEVKSRVRFSSKIEDLSSADFCIEAVSENTELKQNVFRALDKVAGPDTILATNTSSISITKIAAVTSRPEKVIGMHFFYPVPVLELVEIVKGLATAQTTVDKTVQLARAMGKTTTNALDVPGFISNRILMPYINEAFLTLQENIGTPEDIDTTMKLGTNVPMGPLTLADFIGLDTCLNIMRVLHENLGSDKYAPAPLLIKYVDAGWLGRKTGRGVFSYAAAIKK